MTINTFCTKNPNPNPNPNPYTKNSGTHVIAEKLLQITISIKNPNPFTKMSGTTRYS
jgi:hypothetical protein